MDEEGCLTYRPKMREDGSLEKVWCDLDVGHEPPHHFPTEWEIVDADGKPAPHPDCEWLPSKWKRGSKWNIQGMVMVCLVHGKPTPCKGNPEFGYYDYTFKDGQEVYEKRAKNP